VQEYDAPGSDKLCAGAHHTSFWYTPDVDDRSGCVFHVASVLGVRGIHEDQGIEFISIFCLG
jgi:hypothetical protein